eukprot:symbB.v1.2.038979.t1/scaffold6275.1/size19478/1
MGSTIHSNTMPPKLLDGTSLAFSLENPKRAGSKAHDRFEHYKHAKTVAEALQLGASRSDIANDVKNGHCTLDGDSMGQKRREQLECERPAKQQRIDAPVLPSENGTPGTEGTQTGSGSSSLPGTSSQGSGSGLKTEKAPLQEVDLSFAKLDGKPIKFVKRTMGEARRLLSPEGLAEAEKSGYKFCLKDKENLSKWLVQLKDLNPDGKLVADLQKHSLDAQIDLELILPDGFPMEPPFARVVYPQLRGGYVFERGGICFEPLTQKGWVPSMTLPALAIAIKGIFDYGEVRVAGVGDKATRTVKHYTEEGARKDHTAISAAHRGGESSTYGSIRHYSS